MRDTENGSHNDASLPEHYQKQNGSHSKQSASSGAHISHFLPTSRRIVQFSNGKVLIGQTLVNLKLSSYVFIFFFNF